ncbi:hypothetical protein PTTG_28350 [Puccinia triticina 1-1 BBBD Race 1]|uniref:Uncharacterized protein n=2 Tax=Puccinia triticina TaxID=208348 RepID=A0A180GD23_PUCT1|nr:hypothetical protein PTTG_28350 [Puccinia triticina 1-1 BBBD Race 1]
MSVLHNHVATDEGVKEWLKILAYTLRQVKDAGSSVLPHLAISASYGLFSLNLRYRNLGGRLLDISAVLDIVKHYHQGIAVLGADFIRWEHELYWPGRFGPHIEIRDNFMQIINLDEDLKNAMSSSRQKDGWHYLKKLCGEFNSSSAYRRLVTLGIFYHKFKKHENSKTFMGLFQTISGAVLRHEEGLLGLIENQSRNTGTTRVLPSKS